MAKRPDLEIKSAADAAAARLSGLNATAETRAHQLKTRFVIAAIAAIICSFAVSYIWAAAWFAAVIVSQIVDAHVWKPFRDPGRRHPPTRQEWIALCVSSSQVTLIYSFFTLSLWFMWGEQGKIFAMIWLCGALLHVTMHMHHEKRTFLAAIIPHLSYFLALPLFTLITGEALDRMGSAMILLAGLMYVAHLVVAFREYQATSSTMRLAREHALQRQATAEQANDAKSTFLANMSHEIRTPMNGILGMAAALEASDLRPEQKRQLKIIRESGDLMMTVLNDLLDFSKIEANHVEFEHAPFRFTDVAKKVESLHCLQAQEKGIGFSVSCDGESDRLLLGDAHRIVQILHNLVNNAIKFTDEGSVTVTISAAARKGSFHQVTIEVADTGIGVDREQAAHIFEPFTQADAATTRKYGGTGLGLSIVRGLVDAMGGAISIDSEVGKGTKITVVASLRTAPDAKRADAPSTPITADDAVKALRILAAEDNTVNQAVLRTFLSQRHHDVQFAGDGLEAVETFKNGDFDLVLMDISMPVLDGVEAMRQMRFIERSRNVAKATPIIAVSAHAMKQQVEEYMELGFAGYLTKPLRAEAVHAEIDRVMGPNDNRSAAANIA